MSAIVSWIAVSALPARELSFDDRVAAQKAIEQVYWNHRLWPKENPGPKPHLAAVMPDAMIRAKVEDYLKKSNVLEIWWQGPVSALQLQAELNRMAANSRDGAVLRELFRALGNDPFLIAETLGRQTLVERLIRNWYGSEGKAEASPKRSFDDWWDQTRGTVGTVLVETSGTFVLPDAPSTPCTNDTWRPTRFEMPDPREGHTAVWTGSEMIVWGGSTSNVSRTNTGGRYNPATDTWTLTSTGTNVPIARDGHTAVWTGTAMIVWGGNNGSVDLDSGGRYEPATDSWTATSTGANVPAARQLATAVWTGTAMIVWGGYNGADLNTGGRYSPSSDTWTPTSGTNAPTGVHEHTAVWTGSEMIVWGGYNGGYWNGGGRYSFSNDSWTVIPPLPLAPTARRRHTASLDRHGDDRLWGGEGSNGPVNTAGASIRTTTAECYLDGGESTGVCGTAHRGLDGDCDDRLGRWIIVNLNSGGRLRTDQQ
jgi:hypothetical protein